MTGINILVSEINGEIESHAKIVNTMSNLSISYKNKNNLTNLVHIICRNSNVLLCMKFYITNKNNRPFFDFYEKIFLSPASAYRIRQSCKEYLESIDLGIEQNTICGDEYRIRFLIALLYYKYGVNCCNINEQDMLTIRKYVLSTNDVIDMNYLQHMQMEYNYFEYLFILAWKRKQYDVRISQSKEFDKLKEIFIYNEMKTTIKRRLEHYFSSRCTEIKPLLINAENISFLYSQKNCIIVLEKKIEDLIKFHMKENENKKIISITVEKGKREIRAIEDAIFEPKINQDAVRLMKSFGL